MAKTAVAKRPKAKAKPRNQGRTQPVQDPGSRNTWIWFPRTSTGIRVNHDNAFTLSVWWCCVRVISETLSTLPWRVMRTLTTGGKEPTPDHPIDWLIHKQANPEMSASRFKRQMGLWACTWGNAYAEIERNRRNEPVWLWPITPDRVQIGRDDSGTLVYEIDNFTREPVFIPFTNMLHFTGIGYDGLVGFDVVAMASKAIGLALDMEGDARSFWANDSTPSGVLKHPGTLGDEAMKSLRKSWEMLHGGINKGRIAILEEDMSFEAIGRPQKDSEFKDTRQAQLLEICRFMRVPPHKVYELGRATWGNLEIQETEFMQDSIDPWLIELEEEANLKLFGIQQKGVYFTRFNRNARLRGDSEARGNLYTTFRTLGMADADELRALEDWNPIGEEKGGKKKLVQINQTTLEKIGEEPVEPAQPPAGPLQPTKDDEQEDSEEPQTNRIRAAYLPVIEDALTRILRREQKHAENSEKRGVANWQGAFYSEHRIYARQALLPVASALANLVSENVNGNLDAVLDNYLSRHIEASMAGNISEDRAKPAARVLADSVIGAVRT